MVAVTLRDAGYEVVEACSGDEALEFAKNRSVDLVLTDINMPNMDGLSLIRALRTLPAYRFIPILTLTTEFAGEMKEEGKAAGASGWIVKPFDPHRLLQTLKKVIG